MPTLKPGRRERDRSPRRQTAAALNLLGYHRRRNRCGTGMGAGSPPASLPEGRKLAPRTAVQAGHGTALPAQPAGSGKSPRTVGSAQPLPGGADLAGARAQVSAYSAVRDIGQGSCRLTRVQPPATLTLRPAKSVAEADGVLGGHRVVPRAACSAGQRCCSLHPVRAAQVPAQTAGGNTTSPRVE